MISSAVEQNKKLEEAFSRGEASVALEGFNPQAHPLYAILKQKVVSGEMTAEQMGSALIADALSAGSVSTAA